jgi:hypothetical protein
MQLLGKLSVRNKLMLLMGLFVTGNLARMSTDLQRVVSGFKLA